MVMVTRRQLIRERDLLVAAGYSLPPLPPAPAVEEVQQRLERMWTTGRSIALIRAMTGLEPHEIRDRCRGLPRRSIRVLSAGASRPSESPRGVSAARRSSQTSGVANGAGLSLISTAGAVRP